MAKDILRYDLMVQDALKGVVRKILTEAGRDGLPGEHHFYVTFRTTAPGVRVSQRLRDKHPGGDDDRAPAPVLGPERRASTPSRSGCPSRACPSGCWSRSLRSTASSIRRCKFGLKFDVRDVEAANGTTEDAALPLPAPALQQVPKPQRAAPPSKLPAKPRKDEAAEKTDKTAATDKKPADVVSLDAFRKKT